MTLRIAQEKEAWRRQFGQDLVEAVPNSSVQALSRAPSSALTWQLDAQTFIAVVIEQLRSHDVIPLQLFLQRLREMRALVESDKRDDVETVLQRLACLGALSIKLDLVNTLAEAPEYGQVFNPAIRIANKSLQRRMHDNTKDCI